MINKLKSPVFLLLFTFLIILPRVSYAHSDRNNRDNHSHHWRGGDQCHANPDLTLVSGMDNVDTKVLVDPAPDS